MTTSLPVEWECQQILIELYLPVKLLFHVVPQLLLCFLKTSGYTYE